MIIGASGLAELAGGIACPIIIMSKASYLGYRSTAARSRFASKEAPAYSCLESRPPGDIMAASRQIIARSQYAGIGGIIVAAPFVAKCPAALRRNSLASSGMKGEAEREAAFLSIEIVMAA